MGKETERTKTIIESDNDYTIPFGELLAIVSAEFAEVATKAPV